jgi:acyl-CoA hydrolase
VEIDITPLIIHHLIKSEDLNHHGTLFAGRSAEWFVESGFIAAASLLPPKNIVCLKIHGMTFTKPARSGEIVRFESKIVLTGRSRLIAYVEATAKGQYLAEGFLTFVHVNDQGQSQPHGIVITPTRPADIALQDKAKSL